MKNLSANIFLYPLVTVLLDAGVYLFWLLGYPQMLNYHEQYQLFLFTSDYFTATLAYPGGIADYLSEFLVQFYYVPAIGAAMIALLMCALQVATAACLIKGSDGRYTAALYILSALPAVMLTRYMGDENLLLSLPVALALTQILALCVLGCGIRRLWVMLAVLAVTFTAAYWICGPVALLLPVEAALLSPALERRWVALAASVAWSLAAIFVLGRLFLQQYPETQMFFGINYCRITNVHPAAVFVIPAVLAALAVGAFCVRRYAGTADGRSPAGRWLPVGGAVVVVLIAVAAVPSGFIAEKMDILEYDRLVRNEKWHDIIDKAQKKAPADPMSLQAVNLALAKTGRLGDSMFQFPQQGIESLLASYSRDNTTCLITAEAFWHLGMVNSAYRYAFDLQEAIMNDRKSGRFTRRLVDCLMINGKYSVARKFNNMLRHSLYYSDYADATAEALADTARVAANPVWSAKRGVRFRSEMLYDYNEIEKMLGLLALESEGRNPLAWDYFNAALMLKGDLPTLVGMYHYAGETFHLTEIPAQVQEAIGMFWTFGHQSFDDIPYRISPEVQQRITALAQTVMANRDNPALWRARFPNTYCVYFLEQQARNAPQAAATNQKGAPREG